MIALIDLNTSVAKYKKAPLNIDKEILCQFCFVLKMSPKTSYISCLNSCTGLSLKSQKWELSSYPTETLSSDWLMKLR